MRPCRTTGGTLRHYNELEFRWVQEPATRLATLLTEEVHLSDIERASRPQALKKGMKIITSSQPAMFNKWILRRVVVDRAGQAGCQPALPEKS